MRAAWRQPRTSTRLEFGSSDWTCSAPSYLVAGSNRVLTTRTVFEVHAMWLSKSIAELLKYAP